jgi:3-oxoadipate enol-lactonase
MLTNLSGLTQYYDDKGPKNGVPIIFIHGFPFDSSTWQSQVNVIPERFRTITYDVRGHGQSEAGPTPYSLEFFVDDLFALIKKLELDQPILCGLSMGGYIALRAFERWPALFRALILCDTRSEGDSNQAKINRANAIKTIREFGTTQFAEDSVKNLFWEGNANNRIAEIKNVKEIIEKTSPDVICATSMALAARTDTTEVLADIKVPVLIIVGEHDKITPPIASESLHEVIKDSELVVIKNAGHLSNLENPLDFNEALVGFLERF